LAACRTHTRGKRGCMVLGRGMRCRCCVYECVDAWVNLPMLYMHSGHAMRLSACACVRECRGCACQPVHALECVCMDLCVSA
jgi:hypothetical protein